MYFHLSSHPSSKYCLAHEIRAYLEWYDLRQITYALKIQYVLFVSFCINSSHAMDDKGTLPLVLTH